MAQNLDIRGPSKHLLNEETIYIETEDTSIWGDIYCWSMSGEITNNVSLHIFIFKKNSKS